MQESSNIPSFLKSLFLWTVNSLISTTHFLAILVIAPFSRRKGFDILRSWSRCVSKLVRVDVAVRDESSGNWGPPPHLFILLNQNSLAEVIVYPLALPNYRAIINIEFAALPFTGWTWTILGSIVIVRQWKKQVRRGIERAQQSLKNGENIGISIEGRRSPDGSISS